MGKSEAQGGAFAPLPFREPSHVGIATVDIDAAIERLAPQFGLTWETPRLRELALVTPKGPVDWWFRVAHSNGPMSVELLQGSPGSIWYTDRATELHHFGYQSTTFDAELQALVADSWEIDVTWPDATGAPSVFAYLSKAGHPRIELYEASARRPA